MANACWTLTLGNTHASLVGWSAAGKRQRHLRLPAQIRSLAPLVAALESPGAPLIWTSVAPQLSAALEAILRQRPIPAFRFGYPHLCPLRLLPRPAASVGSDRLAAAVGALARAPQHPWVIVDAGTALTLNALLPVRGSQPATFAGGLILPGERLSLQALGHGTAQLPVLHPLPDKTRLKPIGRSTAEALRHGVRQALLVAVPALVLAQVQILGPQTRIALTGGGAPALWPSFQRVLARYHPVQAPFLVHEGLYAAGRSLTSS